MNCLINSCILFLASVWSLLSLVILASILVLRPVVSSWPLGRSSLTSVLCIGRGSVELPTPACRHVAVYRYLLLPTVGNTPIGLLSLVGFFLCTGVLVENWLKIFWTESFLTSSFFSAFSYQFPCFYRHFHLFLPSLITTCLIRLPTKPWTTTCAVQMDLGMRRIVRWQLCMHFVALLVC